VGGEPATQPQRDECWAGLAESTRGEKGGRAPAGEQRKELVTPLWKAGVVQSQRTRMGQGLSSSESSVNFYLKGR
jgi:hypothetical protein